MQAGDGRPRCRRARGYCASAGCSTQRRAPVRRGFDVFGAAFARGWGRRGCDELHVVARRAGDCAKMASSVPPTEYSLGIRGGRMQCDRSGHGERHGEVEGAQGGVSALWIPPLPWLGQRRRRMLGRTRAYTNATTPCVAPCTGPFAAGVVCGRADVHRAHRGQAIGERRIARRPSMLSGTLTSRDSFVCRACIAIERGARGVSGSFAHCVPEEAPVRHPRCSQCVRKMAKEVGRICEPVSDSAPSPEYSLWHHEHNRYCCPPSVLTLVRLSVILCLEQFGKKIQAPQKKKIGSNLDPHYVNHVGA
ncbi:hypothetical protein DFH06DRAFT_123413 [Mycena polygramma]|nr:hypothetical protein DFH06DRAFT_123413 [Mycena polygramma]